MTAKILDLSFSLQQTTAARSSKRLLYWGFGGDATWHEY